MSLEALTDFLYRPYPRAAWHSEAADVLGSLWAAGGRFRQSADKIVTVRSPRIEDGVAFAAIIHPDNPTSGAYRGMSFVLFPSPTAPALVGLLVGTDGTGPDAPILGKPGHARKCQALAQWLNQTHRADVAWAKVDPTRCEEPLPRTVRENRSYEPYLPALDRYGAVMYLLFAPTPDRDRTREGLEAIIDLMFGERGVSPLASFLSSSAARQRAWLAGLLPPMERDEIASALDTHRYVILQGPPGTGKTRALYNLAHSRFRGSSSIVQFHANTTYESFVGGLAPTPSAGTVGLSFAPRGGALLQAISAARANPSAEYLLGIDEINRADLAKALGEAIVLLEPRRDHSREVRLEHDYSEIGSSLVSMPENLYILGTMNTADRSIAIVDVAVRRRFAFLDMWPQLDLVTDEVTPLAPEAFQRLLSIFIEHATDDAFSLIPGHSYFMATSEREFGNTLRYSLIPLLREYLAQGYVAGFAAEVRAYIQWLEYQWQ